VSELRDYEFSFKNAPRELDRRKWDSHRDARIRVRATSYDAALRLACELARVMMPSPYADLDRHNPR
jgi:hypothetical protein